MVYSHLFPTAFSQVPSWACGEARESPCASRSSVWYTRRPKTLCSQQSREDLHSWDLASYLESLEAL